MKKQIKPHFPFRRPMPTTTVVTSSFAAPRRTSSVAARRLCATTNRTLMGYRNPPSEDGYAAERQDKRRSPRSGKRWALFGIRCQRQRSCLHRLPLRGERPLLPLRGFALPRTEPYALSESAERGRLRRGAARQKTFAAERQTMGAIRHPMPTTTVVYTLLRQRSHLIRLQSIDFTQRRIRLTEFPGSRLG